jgi:hypothetical protein
MKSNTAENAALYYEASQAVTAMSLLTDSGDHQLYTSAVTLWSDKSGYSPVVRPDGLISGGVISPDNSVVDNVVDVSALTCYLAGVLTVVNAGTVTASRGAVLACRITSVVITNAGALNVIAGTEGAAISETRAAAGGPPLITVGYIEIGQVRLTATGAAVVAASEIFQTPGTHQERWDYPLWEEYNGPSQDGTIPGGCVKLLSALAEIHTGAVARRVYASYSLPNFAEVRPVTDFVPPTNTHSVASTQVYGGTVGSRSSSLSQGSFTAYLSNGVNDAVLRLRDYVLWFKFFPDRYKSPYILTQGKLGVSQTFPADNSITAACTISASEAAVNIDA